MIINGKKLSKGWHSIVEAPLANDLRKLARLSNKQSSFPLVSSYLSTCEMFCVILKIAELIMEIGLIKKKDITAQTHLINEVEEECSSFQIGDLCGDMCF